VVKEVHMANSNELEYEDQVLKTYVEEDIAIVKVKCNVFETLADIVESGRLISFFNKAEKNTQVKAVLIINEDGCLNEQEYDQYFQRLIQKEQTMEHGGSTSPIFSSLERTRQINLLSRVIIQILDFKKISVIGMQGDIVTPFFGTSLAADFRFAATGMSYSLAHLKEGHHPGGCLPFFLPLYVGRGKAIEILFKGAKISALEAKQMGLITEIFPSENFERRCLQEIHQLCQLSPKVIHTTKMLLNYDKDELQEYFGAESALTH